MWHMVGSMYGEVGSSKPRQGELGGKCLYYIRLEYFNGLLQKQHDSDFFVGLRGLRRANEPIHTHRS
jgi:hypothetical protein